MAIQNQIERLAGNIATQGDLIQQIKAGLSETKEGINRANNEISTQAALIHQITNELESKASGVQLPTLTNPGSASDLAQGVQLIGPAGEVVEGAVPVPEGGFYDTYTDIFTDEYLLSPFYRLQSDVLLRAGTEIYVDVPATDYGDLTPEEAPKGKTFTSASGFCVTGTAEPSGVSVATAKLSSNGTSISFTGLTAQPKMFCICPTGNITLGSTRYVTGVMYDGSKTHGTYGYRSSSSGTSYYSASYFTWTYSNGTLTVRSSSSTNGGNFSSSVTYQLTYIA